MDVYVDGNMDIWAYGRMCVCMYVCMGVWVCRCMGMGIWVHGCMGVWECEWVYWCMGVWVNG